MASEYRKYLKQGRTKIGRNRSDCTWTCKNCGKVIIGKANTIHLGVLSHWRKCSKNMALGKRWDRSN